jgi:YHS domain-containing protein
MPRSGLPLLTQTVAVSQSTIAVPKPILFEPKMAVVAESGMTVDTKFTRIDEAEDPDPPFTTTLRRDSGRRIGLDGYCPVSLSTESKWVRGEAEFQYEYQRVSYSLSSDKELKSFIADPEKYIPYLHGCDPVALGNDNRVQIGAIELGAAYGKRVYFFASERNRAAFLKAPQRFSAERNTVANTQ